VEKLLKKMNIPQLTIDKCLKVPLSQFAKVLELTHKMVSGKVKYERLADLKTLICDDLKIIPAKLKDAKVMADVKGYIERHVKTSRK